MISGQFLCSNNNGCGCCCLGIAPRAQLLMKSAWLLHQIGDKAPPAARNSSEVAGVLNPRTGNGDHGWCLSSSLFLSVGFSIQDEAMDVAPSAPQGLTTIRPLFTCFLKRGAWGSCYSGLGLHQLGSKPTFFIPVRLSMLSLSNKTR